MAVTLDSTLLSRRQIPHRQLEESSSLQRRRETDATTLTYLSGRQEKAKMKLKAALDTTSTVIMTKGLLADSAAPSPSTKDAGERSNTMPEGRNLK